MYKEELLGKILDTFVSGGKPQLMNFRRAIKVSWLLMNYSCYLNFMQISLPRHLAGEDWMDVTLDEFADCWSNLGTYAAHT